MGGDHGPSVVVAGVRDYIRRYGGEGVRFVLHGDEQAIARELTRCRLSGEVCEVRHTDKVVAMDEKPAQAMRRGKGSSMWNAIEAVKADMEKPVPMDRVIVGDVGYISVLDVDPAFGPTTGHLCAQPRSP